MMMNCEQYRQSLRDGRRVFVEGQLVEDVTQHPVLKLPVDIAADLYDLGYDAAPDAMRQITPNPAPDDIPSLRQPEACR